MKNILVVLFAVIFLNACNYEEQISPQMEIEEADSGFFDFNGCFILATTNPSDGSCPASYAFNVAPSVGCSNYSWSVSGDAYFNSGTTSSSASVIVQRKLYVGGSFTITANLTCNGIRRSCSQTYLVTAESYCP